MRSSGQSNEDAVVTGHRHRSGYKDDDEGTTSTMSTYVPHRRRSSTCSHLSSGHHQMRRSAKGHVEIFRVGILLTVEDR